MRQVADKWAIVFGSEKCERWIGSARTAPGEVVLSEIERMKDGEAELEWRAAGTRRRRQSRVDGRRRWSAPERSPRLRVMAERGAPEPPRGEGRVRE